MLKINNGNTRNKTYNENGLDRSINMKINICLKFGNEEKSWAKHSVLKFLDCNSHFLSKLSTE